MPRYCKGRTKQTRQKGSKARLANWGSFKSSGHAGRPWVLVRESFQIDLAERRSRVLRSALVVRARRRRSDGRRWLNILFINHSASGFQIEHVSAMLYLKQDVSWHLSEIHRQTIEHDSKWLCKTYGKSANLPLFPLTSFVFWETFDCATDILDIFLRFFGFLVWFPVELFSSISLRWSWIAARLPSSLPVLSWSCLLNELGAFDTSREERRDMLTNGSRMRWQHCKQCKPYTVTRPGRWGGKGSDRFLSRFSDITA